MPDTTMQVTSGQTNFTDIKACFNAQNDQNIDPDRKLRFGDKGLYIKGEDSLGLPHQVQERTNKRNEALEKIKEAITTDYDQSVTDRVFQNLNCGQGVTVG